MKTKIKIIYLLSFFILFSGVLASCSENDEPVQEPEIPSDVGNEKKETVYEVIDKEAIVASVAEEEEVIIPSEVVIEGVSYPVTKIKADAAKNNKYIKTLYLPSSINFIGKEAFLFTEIENLYIESIESWCNIYFETDIASIHNSISYSDATPISNNTSIFVDGKKLEVLEIPETVEIIPEFAFQNINVKNIVFPPNIHKIPLGSFEGCIVDELVFPESISQIGHQAFQNASVSKIYFPESVEHICMYAFDHCQNVKEITFDCSPTIEECAFDFVYSFSLYLNYPISDVYTSDGYYPLCPKKIFVPNLDVWLKSYFISLWGGWYDLYINDKPATELSIPAGNYEYKCFDSIHNVESLTFEEGTEKIKSISYCKNLKFISFPSSLNYVKQIYDNTALMAIELKAETPPDNDFDSYYVNDRDNYILYNNCTLYVPENSVEAYQNAEGWKRFKNIVGTQFPGSEDLNSSL